MRMFILFLIGLSLATFTNCGEFREKFRRKKEFVAELDIDKIRERGYLSVSMDNNSTGYFLYRGKTMGFEYELLKRFADEQGLELRIEVTKSLEEAFNKLNRGDTDILAYNLTVTEERKKRIAFTDHHNLIRQVLVQRKPEGWEKMHPNTVDKLVIRNPVNLVGKTIYVRHHSAHKERMENLSSEIGGGIIIVEDSSYLETEEIIQKVANGEIDFTVAEEDVALVNASFYQNLDVQTPVSFPQQIAWGVRKTSDSLLISLNDWLSRMKKHPAYSVIYDRYFTKRQAQLSPDNEYFTTQNGRISPYDDLIKEAADELGWDWRLLAAMIYRESKFNPKAESWAGAKGLMQLMPNTAEAHGVVNPEDPRESIRAGKKHLIWLQNIWKDEILDVEERAKFVIASYNVGQGHIQDAVVLARKNGLSGLKWDGEVEQYLLKKSNPTFYRDPDVKYGYCRGLETVTYIRSVFNIYNTYKELALK